jgi:AcrR family transcriptional regulator
MARKRSAARLGRRKEIGEDEWKLRRATERSMLKLTGELGYQNVTVAALMERSSSNRSRFYATFGGKDSCYAAAYEGEIERLVGRMLGSCGKTGGWIAGMRSALIELVAFVSEDPDLAKGVIVGVHAAGGKAFAKRVDVVGRLSRAIDHARQETGSSPNSPPPVTAMFIAQAIETAVIRSLSEERPLSQDLAGLLYISVVPYYGASRAWREVARMAGAD